VWYLRVLLGLLKEVSNSHTIGLLKIILVGNKTPSRYISPLQKQILKPDSMFNTEGHVPNVILKHHYKFMLG